MLCQLENEGDRAVLGQGPRILSPVDTNDKTETGETDVSTDYTDYTALKERRKRQKHESTNYTKGEA